MPLKAYQQLSAAPIRELYADENLKQDLLDRLNDLPKVNLTLIDLQWLQVLAEGWASPLSGFMRERQYLQCLHHGLLLDLKRDCSVPGVPPPESDDSIWSLNEPLNQSVPIVLPIDDRTKAGLMQGYC
ncbi:unnamed protein product [Gongylonema pulchrum]|uniref:ATP-sulfurylase PUA-like domain-containing protein n=1 Tax=Gongylonema pulchrum TaxID=637853 RepID=A0A3P6R0B8_9BILA|nr:unnamed protein product [Gongylonema pulchrum]